MSTASFRAIDGGTVEIASATLEVGDPGWTTFSVFSGFGDAQEFGAGNGEFGHELVARDGIGFSENYTLSDGASFKVGRLVQTDPVLGFTEEVRLGVRFGADSSVKSEVYDGASSDLISMFNAFTVPETLAGAVLVPNDPTVTKISKNSARAPELNQHVPGLGLLEIVQRTPEQEWQVPTEAGAPVAGGQLYVDETSPAEDDDEDTQITLLLVGDTALTRIFPDPGIGESALIAGAGELEVRWNEDRASVASTMDLVVECNPSFIPLFNIGGQLPGEGPASGSGTGTGILVYADASGEPQTATDVEFDFDGEYRADTCTSNFYLLGELRASTVGGGPIFRSEVSMQITTMTLSRTYGYINGSNARIDGAPIDVELIGGTCNAVTGVRVRGSYIVAGAVR